MGYRGMGRGGVDLDSGDKHPARTYLRLLRYARPYWRWLVLTVLLSFATAYVSVLPPQVIGLSVNELAGRGEAQVSGLMVAEPLQNAVVAVQQRMPSANPTVVTFATYGGAFLLLFLLSSAIGVIQSLSMAYIGQSLIKNLRNDTYRHMQRLSLRYFDDRQTGDIMSRVVNDVNSLERVIVDPVVSLLTDLARLVFLLYFCLSWDWMLTLLGVAITPLLVLCTWGFGLLLRKHFRALRTRVGDLNGRLQDNISGVRVIKAFGTERREAEQFAEVNQANYAIHMKLARLFALFRPTVGVLNHLGMLIVLCVGGIRAAQGKMEIGIFVVFFEYLRQMYGPINGLTRFYSFIQRALASGERVFELLDEQPEVTEPESPVELTAVQGEVAFRNVSFAYSEEADPALTGVTFDLKANEMVALVGPSGAGKTTLVNLLLRFYDPGEGAVTIDGHDLRALGHDTLRGNVAVVMQDPFLFNDTVMANIIYARPDATEAEARVAAEAAGADEFIAALPKGYETQIGERGVKLSGGQRQRVSIARAILADPKILILDEATSSVDTETELLIQRAIYRLARDRTMLVIAHRLSTVQRADRIVVLDGGKVVEDGSHEDLLAIDDGLYRRLCESGEMNGEDAIRGSSQH